MFWSHVWTVFTKELRDSLRDRRAVISMFVVPTLVMPLLLLTAGAVMAKIVKKAQDEASPVVVVGGADSPELLAALRADARMRVVEPQGDFRRMIADNRVRAAAEIPEGFAAALAAGEPTSVTLHHNEGDMKSGFGLRDLERFFREYRDRTVAARLEARGLPAALVRPFEIHRSNAAPEKKAGNLLGGIVPYVIILLCFTGAMYPAIDLTAGEKERGTMETLLCSPVDRTALVFGKFLTVLSASLATMACTLVSMVACILVGGTVMLAGPEGAAAAGEGAKLSLDLLGAAGVFVMVLPIAVLFAAVLLAVALCAKTTKEAQTYVSPLVFVIVLPAMIGMLPGVELNTKLALVPVLNLTLACKELLTGVWHWPYLALIFGSTALYAAAALAGAVALFKRESVLFRT
ncbi:MAG TPA: ABC transporter permease [Opitutaceae bacterium]|nr:ABC transporter permease [Opitutaceae bacterium]